MAGAGWAGLRRAAVRATRVRARVARMLAEAQRTGLTEVLVRVRGSAAA